MLLVEGGGGGYISNQMHVQLCMTPWTSRGGGQEYALAPPPLEGQKNVFYRGGLFANFSSL